MVITAINTKTENPVDLIFLAVNPCNLGVCNKAPTSFVLNLSSPSNGSASISRYALSKFPHRILISSTLALTNLSALYSLLSFTLLNNIETLHNWESNATFYTPISPPFQH